ncbi:EAL domain-containing protein [Burkholderia ubonensis]|uniref:EAL domain-containing protein n=1 Tax=Burkholderia ubonensis TaxID=101571 RepID=UPI000A538016|nr:EAL domain-containing protein [Burkholderia ubonensis]
MEYAHNIVVEVLNIRELATYYREAVAGSVMDQLHRRVQQLFRMSVVTTCREPGRVRIGRNDRPMSHHTEEAIDDVHRDAGHLDQLRASLSQPHADCLLLTRLAVLEARRVEEAGGGMKHAPCALHSSASAISASLPLAGDVTDAMHADRLLPSFQPIRVARDRGLELYRACTARVPLVGSPYVLARPSFMPSLERIGRERTFDLFVVQRLIERLRSHGRSRIHRQPSQRHARRIVVIDLRGAGCRCQPRVAPRDRD